MHSCMTSSREDVEHPRNYQRRDPGRGRDPPPKRDPQPRRDPGRTPKKDLQSIFTTVTTTVTKTMGSFKNAAADAFRSRTPPPQRTSNGFHYPSVPHSGPAQYSVSEYYSAPFYHQPSSAPGMALPPVVYTEGRNQPASSSYGNQTASRDADVYKIRAPPPGSYQDDDTGPSPKNLVTAVMGVKSAVNHFAKTLISDMNKYPEELKHLKQRIYDEVQGDVDRANHWKFLVQAFVCQRMFEGFESENGFFGIEQFEDLKKSTISCFTDFTKYKDKAATISELFARGSKDPSFLGRYCFKKFKSICVDPVTNEPLANYEQEWRWVEEERHGQSEFYKSFLKVAVSVWLLHLLVHSFEQGWKMLGWETFPKGNKFQKKTMESVVPGGYEEEDDETGTEVNSVVGFLVIPGFQVSRSVVKCEVYVRKNNVTDGKITEVRSRSLEKSFSDKTPANYHTPSSYQTSANYEARANYEATANYPALPIYPPLPNYPPLSKDQATGNYLTPPKSSTDRSPGSHGNLRMSSNHSGHSSSRGVENVASSTRYWSSKETQLNIAHNRSGRSKSGELDSRGHSQTSSHYLPRYTPPAALVRHTKSSRQREEIAATRREEERRRPDWVT